MVRKYCHEAASISTGYCIRAAQQDAANIINQFISNANAYAKIDMPDDTKDRQVNIDYREAFELLLKLSDSIGKDPRCQDYTVRRDVILVQRNATEVLNRKRKEWLENRYLPNELMAEPGYFAPFAATAGLFSLLFGITIVPIMTAAWSVISAPLSYYQRNHADVYQIDSASSALVNGGQ